MEVFNLNLALEMVDNDSELLEILLNSFLSDKKLDMEMLRGLEKNDRKSAADYVHSIKGPARQLALEKLADAGQKLEDVLRAKMEGDLEALNESFCSEHKTAYERLEGYFSN